ncbi:MAG: C69 family dipeptidase [Candidatus Moduliflexus flocculans]|nr:C69 family dipeptidase [Candidatus Moduliflexus flocculans]
MTDVLAIFRDTYGGTPYDMTRTPARRSTAKGKTVEEPGRDAVHERRLRWTCFRLQAGADDLPASARPTCQITQSREWLPEPIGGVVWLGYDNPTTTPHTPFYIGIVADARRPTWSTAAGAVQPRLRLVGVPARSAGWPIFRWQEMVEGHREGVEAHRGQGLRRPGRVRGGGPGPLEEGPEEGPRAADASTPTAWPTRPWPPTGSSATTSG